MSLVDELFTDMSREVNTLLGNTYTYQHKDASETLNVNITVNRNKPVKDEFGMLAGYFCEASILKSEIAEVNNGEIFIENTSLTKWKITQVDKETSSKFYVNIIEIK